MGRKRRTQFGDNVVTMQRHYALYFDKLMELSLSMFEWKNLPPSIDERFLELTLFEKGSICFFRDDVMGLLCLPFTVNGVYDIYKNPTKLRAYAINGYNANLTNNDSVVVYNNYLRQPSLPDIDTYAKRLANLDTTININTNAQRTPVLITCSPEQELTLKNLYMQYEGNSPVIYGNKNLEVSNFKVLSTGAPYNADKLYTLKTQIWNEALTHLGISNVNVQKKERLITDEVSRNLGSTMASRYSRLNMRQQACKKINDMFGTNISCEFKDDYRVLVEEDEEIEMKKEGKNE